MMKLIGKFAAMAMAWLMASQAQAAFITYFATLSPEVAGSSGTGTVAVLLDRNANLLVIDTTWSDLTGLTSVAHIHCCTAAPGTGTVAVAVTPTTLPGFPAGVTAGSYQIVLDLSDPNTYTAGFVSNFGGGTVAGAEDALANGLDGGLAYLNIHSDFAPTGEIRGFPARVDTVVEPASAALLGLALLGVMGARRMRA